MPADCPVEILLPAFKLGIDSVYATDEAYFGGPKTDEPEREAKWEANTRAWHNLWHLADVALDVTPTSEIGLTMQLALAVDATVVLQACRPGDEQREELCIQIRDVLRAALKRLDQTAIRAAGFGAMYLGDRSAESPATDSAAREPAKT
jgi:hypothetical protein